MKKTTVITIVVLLLILVFYCVSPTVKEANVQWLDTTYNFNYGYIELPNGKVIEGKVQTWLDFEDGDQLQIKINDVTYLTDTTRAVLIYDPNL